VVRALCQLKMSVCPPSWKEKTKREFGELTGCETACGSVSGCGVAMHRLLAFEKRRPRQTPEVILRQAVSEEQSAESPIALGQEHLRVHLPSFAMNCIHHNIALNLTTNGQRRALSGTLLGSQSRVLLTGEGASLLWSQVSSVVMPLLRCSLYDLIVGPRALCVVRFLCTLAPNSFRY